MRWDRGTLGPPPPLAQYTCRTLGVLHPARHITAGSACSASLINRATRIPTKQFRRLPLRSEDRGLAEVPQHVCHPSPGCLHLLCSRTSSQPRVLREEEWPGPGQRGPRVLSAQMTSWWVGSEKCHKDATGWLRGRGGSAPGLEGGEVAFGGQSAESSGGPAGAARGSAWLERRPGRCLWGPGRDRTPVPAHGDRRSAPGWGLYPSGRGATEEESQQEIVTW